MEEIELIKEAIGIADTVEEAKEQAMAELSLTIEDDYDFEVIATPKKKTFGLFGGSKAQVKVWVEVADPKPAKQPKHQPKKEEKKRDDCKHII